MDFHGLTRRELQCLCKRNKIPANITNLAMADGLYALQHVEGLEELMNSSECDILQSPARANASIAANGSKTSARRKPVREVEISQPLTQARVTRRPAGKCAENANVPKTPAIPSRNKTDSACRSLESQMEDDEEEGQTAGVPKTPAYATASVQRAYSTRRSVKLLETTMAELSVCEEAKSKTVKIHLDEQSEDNSEGVLEVEENNLKESDMCTLEKTDNNSVLDKNEPDVCGAGGVSVTEFSSEPVNLEAASVEFSHLTPNNSYDQGEDMCENPLDGDSDIKDAEDDEENCEHDAEIENANEATKDGRIMAHENSSAAYQFPRPTQTTPTKSSPKKHVSAPLVSDDKENNIREANDDGMKTEVKEIADDLTKLSLNNLSIRELKKRLKEHTQQQNGGEMKSVLQDGF